jgi:hypothetical protein
MPQQVKIYKKLIMGQTNQKVKNSSPDINFAEFRCETAATSGDNRGIYNRLYFTGAGGGGESLRSYSDVVGVAVGTVHGAHLSLGFGESTTKGNATGLAAAVRATLGLPDAAMASGGTYCAIMPEIYSFGDNSDAGAVTELSFIRCVNGGNSNGIGDVDDDAFLLVYTGGSTNSGNVIEASTTETNYAYSARCKLNGTTAYLMFASAAG